MISNTVISYEKTECAACKIRFAVDAEFIKARRADSGTFYCPVGHSLTFRESEADRLKKKLAEAEARERREREDKNYFAGRLDEVDAELKNTTRNLKSTKTRLKNQTTRIAAGVCPCCKRTFQNVARHMETKHPKHGK